MKTSVWAHSVRPPRFVPAVGEASGRPQTAETVPHAPPVGAALIRQDEPPGLRSKQSYASADDPAECVVWTRLQRWNVRGVVGTAPYAANCVRGERRGAHPLRGKSAPYGDGERRADRPRYGWVRRCGDADGH